LYCIVLTACTAAVSFFQNPSLDRESNTHPNFWPSKTVKRVRIRFENIRYLLTPNSRVLLEKLTSSQLVKKFPEFYGTQRFITTFTSASHLSLSWAMHLHSTVIACQVSNWLWRSQFIYNIACNSLNFLILLMQFKNTDRKCIYIFTGLEFISVLLPNYL
jgi:hypothetical protein